MSHSINGISVEWYKYKKYVIPVLSKKLIYLTFFKKSKPLNQFHISLSKTAFLSETKNYRNNRKYLK